METITGVTNRYIRDTTSSDIRIIIERTDAKIIEKLINDLVISRSVTNAKSKQYQRYRDIFIARYISKNSRKDIACKFNITVGRVDEILKRFGAIIRYRASVMENN